MPQSNALSEQDPFNLDNAVKIARKSGFALAGIFVCNVLTFVVSPLAATLFAVSHQPVKAASCLAGAAITYFAGSRLRKRTEQSINQI